MRAARDVFERDGFLDARITDIAARARTATGSFYSYFSGKEEIFVAVVDDLNQEMLHPPLLEVVEHGDEALIELIVASQRAYLAAYVRNKAMMRVVEQVTNVSDSFRRRRTADAQGYTHANAETIRRLQAAGRVPAAVDPIYAARALSAMVSRTAYITFVLEEETESDGLAETLTHLWLNALALGPAPAPSD